MSWLEANGAVVMKDTWKEFDFLLERGKKLQGKVWILVAFPVCGRWLWLKQGVMVQHSLGF